MTSEEIKKAFDICCSTQTGCTGCPLLKMEKQNGHGCKYNLFISVIELITEQEEEIKSLKTQVEQVHKETAKDIVSYMMNCIAMYSCVTKYDCITIAKQYGVEVEE